MNRHMQQIDHQTGEVVEGFVAYVVPKRKNGFQKGWMAMAQEAMMMLAQSNLTGNDMKVMWAMLARLDYENLIQVNQAEVSEQVGMNRHNVNRSIKKLIELGVILEGVKIGISRSYRLNPNFGWKGSAKGHREALHEHLKVIKDKGAQGAWGSFSDTADMRPPITRQPRLHRAGSVPCKPKTLKMSAYGTFFYCATPRVLPTPWALPTPAFATAGVQGKTSCTLTTERCRLQPVKAKPLRGCFASLDRFPARPLRLVLLPPRRWRGVKGDEVAFYP